MDISNQVETIIQQATENGYIILTAESCTGGLLGSALTDCAGASSVYHGGFITYDNAAKESFIDVSKSILETNGAVSPQCAGAMAIGTLKAYSAGNLSLSITGIAGPGGGSAEKPVGLVYFGCSNKKTDQTYVIEKNFTGNRQSIREQSVLFALKLLDEETQSEQL
jgi:PncC family amidohydrolase